MQRAGQVQFFPVQVGPPTEKTKSRRWIFIGVAVYQMLMGIMAIIEFFNMISGLVMIVGCMIAWFAWKENMNITYLCWWGMFSIVGFVVGVVSAFIGFAIKISTIVIKFNIPLSCLFGVLMWWTLYTEYEQTHDCNDIMTTWLRAFGLLKAKQVLPSSNATLLSSGAALGGFGAIGGFDKAQTGFAWAKHWKDMNPDEVKAAQTLGWTEESWEKHIPPPSDSKKWAELAPNEQEAATRFGWDQQKWDVSQDIAAKEKFMAEKEAQASSWAKGAWSQASNAASGYGSMGPLAPGKKDVVRDPFLTSSQI